MLKQLLQRFATAIGLVLIGLASMIFFMKSSKPSEITATEANSAETKPSTAHNHASSEDHKKCAAKITGTILPLVQLQNTDRSSFSIAELSEKQSVIVIRYLGYGCSHCIEQLLALKKLTARLKSDNIRVVAFSDDPPEQNEMVVQKYKFSQDVFTFAFDPAKSMGRSIGAVYKEEDGTSTELHVTMIVRNRRVGFAHFDTKPMMEIEEIIRQATTAL